MRIQDPGEIQHEDRIIWLDEAAKSLPYVREIFGFSSTRGRKLSQKHVNVVAYATLLPKVKITRLGPFRRRFWYLAKHDPYTASGGPIEGVDPTSIRPKQLSSDMSPSQWNRTGQYKKFK